jgi:uncharacterized protein YlxW (UPF0749 family)
MISDTAVICLVAIGFIVLGFMEAVSAAALRRAQGHIKDLRVKLEDAQTSVNFLQAEVEALRAQQESAKDEALAKRLEAVKAHDKVLRPRDWRDTLKLIDQEQGKHAQG